MTAGFGDKLPIFFQGSPGESLNNPVTIAQGGTGATTKAGGFDALSPMTTLGDTIYGGAAGTGTRLAGNTTSALNLLVQTGTGAVSAAPAWSTPLGAGLPTLAASNTFTGTLNTINTGGNIFKFNAGLSSQTPNLSISAAGGRALAVLAGGSGTGIVYDVAGSFLIGPDTNGNIVGGSSAFPTTVSAWSTTGKQAHTPSASTSGIVADWVLTPAANTGMTSATQSNVFRIQGATRTWADGTTALQQDYLLKNCGYNKTTTSAVFSDAVTLGVEAMPVPGSGVTFTKSWSQVWGTPEATILGKATGNAIGLFGAGITQMVIRNTTNDVESVFYCGSSDFEFGPTSNHPMAFQTNNVISATLSTAGNLTIDGGSAPGLTMGGPIQLKSYTVATLPATPSAGKLAYASDAAVAPCICFGNGTVWKRCDNAATTVI